MKILVVGGGGREHAIIWKMKESGRPAKIFCAPGNGGISTLATCVNIKATDIEGVVKFAKDQAVDLVFVGPDDPLAMGMVDELQAAGIRTFGPNQAAAQIEASKVFAKGLMNKYGIPTAAYEVFDDVDAAREYLKRAPYPTVLKADGLALGKGVIICKNQTEAEQALQAMMVDKAFGEAGSKVIVEEFLTGREVSVIAFTDGKTILPLASSQDHKRAYDNDEGPNTGGMGAFSPSPYYTPEIEKETIEKIIIPTVEAMNAEGRPFKGVLYFGLMLTDKGVKILEYNARLGDPETQALLPRLKNDLLEVIDAVIDEKLDQVELSWDKRATVCVVMASGGYPGHYSKNHEIFDLDSPSTYKDVLIFHAGTRRDGDHVYTAGGRVLGVTAYGDTLKAAADKAYAAAESVRFEGAHYRKDIARKVDS